MKPSVRLDCAPRRHSAYVRGVCSDNGSCSIRRGAERHVSCLVQGSAGKARDAKRWAMVPMSAAGRVIRRSIIAALVQRSLMPQSRSRMSSRGIRRTEAPEGEAVLSYWRSRLSNHTSDTYAGIQIQKFPEDLRVYEHLLWASRANVVIELGSSAGGGTLWFRDRLLAMRRYGRIKAPRVVAVDLIADRTERMVRSVDPFARHIKFIRSDVCAPGLPDRVERLIRPSDRCFVIEDSAHEYGTTMAALRGFSHLVPGGGFFVVEDTCVDRQELRVDDAWPRGVSPAIRDWLGTPLGKEFQVDRSLEYYGITCHPGGFLRRGSVG